MGPYGQNSTAGSRWQKYLYIRGLLAVTIIVPVAWYLLLQLRKISVHGSPWALPKGFHFQNFIDAWKLQTWGLNTLNSVLVRNLGILLLISNCPSRSSIPV